MIDEYEGVNQDWILAKNFVEHLKENNEPLDLKKLCIDTINDKYSVEYFMYVILWTWRYKHIDRSNISGITHWAIWACCETFEMPDGEEPIPPAWNDIDEFKARIALTIDDNYREIWHRLGVDDKEIDEMKR